MQGELDGLAEQARSLTWWWQASRRRPWVALLTVAQFAVGWVALWLVSEPGQWLRVLAAFAAVWPIRFGIRALRQRAARALEVADETSHRTGRREAVGAPPAATHPPTFTWGSRSGHRLAVISLLIAGLAAVGACGIGIGWVQDPPTERDDWYLIGFLVILLVVLPLGLIPLVMGSNLRGIRRVIDAGGPRVPVEVLGIDPKSKLWILQRLDAAGARIGRPISVRLLAGNRLLVAGDQFIADGSLVVPPKNWRRMTPPTVGLTGHDGTLWAHHQELPHSVRVPQPELAQPGSAEVP